MAHPLPARLWCFHCCHEWDTPDAHQPQCCPNCLETPRRVYQVGSTLHAYAYMEKQQILNPPVVLCLRELLHTPYAVQEDQADEVLAVVLPLVQAGKEVQLQVRNLHALKHALLYRLLLDLKAHGLGGSVKWVDIIRVPAWQTMLHQVMTEIYVKKAA